jgi:uncharacterized protein (DUF427 family)
MTREISIWTAAGTWVVRVGGAVIGETSRALELAEPGYAPVIYFPRDDIAQAFLDRSDHKTSCPFKGEASYFSIVSKSRTYENGVWSYENPIATVAAIKDHFAFVIQEGVTVEQI